MKKLMYFTLVLVILSSICMFGAWSPMTQTTETRYNNAPIISAYASEYIYYTSRSIPDDAKTDGGAPTFVGTTGISNACGAIAGAEIVAFYDKYYPNLIPGWDSYYPATGKYRGQSATYIDPMMVELYNLMQTNVAGEGVSESEFKTGLQQYFTNHGYTASFSSVKSGSTLNYSACKSAIDNNKLIVLFTTPGNVYSISEYSNYDIVNSYTISGNHIMIAFGYLQMKYYNSTGLFRTDTYLVVATGRSTPTLAYYKIDSSNLESACIVNVS
ncbi:MAG: hypothetical protein J1G02_01460 [Clostridiales bacterium]|nr:hypothetical protein [Clostridiales bacterium]